MSLHVAVAVDAASFDAGDWIGWTRQADDARLDFVTFEDSFGRHGPDAVLVASRVAPLTRHIGLVPVATTTHTEPFHLSTALATLDYVSKGRAGWQVAVSTDPAEAALLGRRAPLPAGELFEEAADAVEVVRRLWDSWQDDAIIRDVATGRFIDRDRLHYISFDGRYFSVKGPSIVPRPPQGQPVVATVVDGPRSLAFARHAADLVFVAPAGVVNGDGSQVVTPAGVAGGGPKVFVDLRLGDDLERWAGSGVDGIRLRLTDPARELPALSGEILPELRRRGLFRPSSAATLRDRLGLPAAINRYQGAVRA